MSEHLLCLIDRLQLGKDLSWVSDALAQVLVDMRTEGKQGDSASISRYSLVRVVDPKSLQSVEVGPNPTQSVKKVKVSKFAKNLSRERYVHLHARVGNEEPSIFHQFSLVQMRPIRGILRALQCIGHLFNQRVLFREVLKVLIA